MRNIEITFTLKDGDKVVASQDNVFNGLDADQVLFMQGHYGQFFENMRKEAIEWYSEKEQPAKGAIR